MNGSQETARPGAAREPRAPYRPPPCLSERPGVVRGTRVPHGGSAGAVRRAVRPAARGRPGTGAGQGPERAVYRSPEAIRTARSTAAALLRHSVSSETGSESATTPAPACT